MNLAELAIAQAGFCCGAGAAPPRARDLRADPRANQPLAPISAGWDRRLLAASEELSGEALGKYGIVMIDAGQGARIRVWSTDRVAARAAMPAMWRGFPVDVTGSGVIRPQAAHTGQGALMPAEPLGTAYARARDPAEPPELEPLVRQLSAQWAPRGVSFGYSYGRPRPDAITARWFLTAYADRPEEVRALLPMAYGIYEVRLSGVPRARMAQTGRVGLHDLRGVKRALIDWIYDRYGVRPPWLTGGVGIGGTPPGGDRIVVGVKTEADRAKIPPTFYGVPVEVDVVGVIYAQPTQPTRLAQAGGSADGDHVYGAEFAALAPLATQALQGSSGQPTVFQTESPAGTFLASYEKVTNRQSRSYGRTILVIRRMPMTQTQTQRQGQPLALRLPRCPAPFGNTPGRIGGSYDWWWCSFGRQAGMPYDPPAAQATGHAVKVTLGPRGRNS
jgi:hypothetical protein